MSRELPKRIDVTQLSHTELAAVADEAVAVLRNGGVIVYPTDTVYGLGADAMNEEAAARVCSVKGRELNKSMLSLVSDMEMLQEYAHVTELARRLATRFLPGPLSVMLKDKGMLAPQLLGPLGAGFRIPDHALCLAMARKLGTPVVTTSANKSGMPQPCTLDEILASFGEKLSLIDLVLDAGELPLSSPSTLVDARGESVVLLREGAISKDTLTEYL
jgi:L-threonylcarbamoyladenylate synthase